MKQLVPLLPVLYKTWSWVLLHREPQSIQNPRPYTQEHQAPKAIQMDSGHYQDPAYEQPEMQEPDAEDAWRRVQLSGSGFRV